MTLNEAIDAVESDAISEDDDEYASPNAFLSIGFGAIAIFQTLSLALSGIDQWMGIYMLLWLCGACVVVYDVRTRKKHEDRTSWGWAIGSFVPIFSPGVVFAYALSRFSKGIPVSVPWLWIAFPFAVACGALIMIGPETSETAGDQVYAGVMLTTPVAPLAIYRDAISIHRSRQSSLYPRLWTVLSAVWIFNVLTVALYTLQRRRFLRQNPDVGEMLDAAESQLTEGETAADDGDHQTALVALEEVDSILEDMEEVEISNDDLSTRIASIEERLDDARRQVRSRSRREAYERSFEEADAALADAKRAAERGELEHAVERAASAQRNAREAVESANDAEIETGDAESLREQAERRQGEWERHWLERRIDTADASGSDDCEEAVTELESVLSDLSSATTTGPEWDRLRSKAKEAYVDAVTASVEAALAEAEEHAENGDHEAAREAFAEAIARAERSSVEAAEIERLHQRARRRSSDWERDWLIDRINAAKGADADKHEAALAELESVLSVLSETDALSGRDLEVVRSEAKEAYARALALRIEATISEAQESIDNGDYEAARETFAEAIEQVGDTRAAARERDVDVDVDQFGERVERGFVNATVRTIERRLAAGVEAFEDGSYEEAREAFTGIADDVDESVSKIESDERRQRLEALRDLAEDNADAAHRAALGIDPETIELRGSAVSPDPTGSADVDTARKDSGKDAGGGSGTTSATSSSPPIGSDARAAAPIPADMDVSYEAISKGEPIGSGGSAEVFHATVDIDGVRHSAALKEPRMRGTLHADTIDRFVEEARTWEQLDDHDNIVGLIDWDSSPLPWLLLEYMDGGNLAQHADAVSLERGLWTARRVTEGVHHAHSLGVAHLDLKPENILFRRPDDDSWPIPKVGDWGLARALLHDDGDVTGLSPRYAAPEQINDRFGEPNQATDIYQLGSVFYELFVGHPPFTGEEHGVLTKTVEEPVVPPSEANPSLPGQLDDALLPALEKDQDDRYESVLYLRDALADLSSAVNPSQSG